MGLWQDLVNGVAALPEWQQRTVLFFGVLFIGVFLIRFVERLVDGAMHRSQRIDATLRNFLDSVTNVLGWIVLVVVLLAIVGVDVGAALSGLAIGGFVIGFALKDTLGNLAAGVMLLFYRPFRVGDTVTIGGESGEVLDLGISLSTLKAGDGRIITIPNGTILRGTVTNHTREPIRRADVAVGIGYDDDVGAAVQAILSALAADPRVLDDPAPTVRMTGLDASAVGLMVRPWVKTSDFWQAKADLHATVKNALQDAGVSIPFPQTEVTMRT